MNRIGIQCFRYCFTILKSDCNQREQTKLIMMMMLMMMTALLLRSASVQHLSRRMRAQTQKHLILHSVDFNFRSFVDCLIDFNVKVMRYIACGVLHSNGTKHKFHFHAVIVLHGITGLQRQPLACFQWKAGQLEAIGRGFE